MKSKATILIVDDVQYNLIILSNMLSNYGYTVMESSNGVDPIQKCCRFLSYIYRLQLR